MQIPDGGEGVETRERALPQKYRLYKLCIKRGLADRHTHVHREIEREKVEEGGGLGTRLEERKRGNKKMKGDERKESHCPGRNNRPQIFSWDKAG